MISQSTNEQYHPSPNTTYFSANCLAGRQSRMLNMISDLLSISLAIFYSLCTRSFVATTSTFPACNYSFTVCCLLVFFLSFSFIIALLIFVRGPNSKNRLLTFFYLILYFSPLSFLQFYFQHT